LPKLATSSRQEPTPARGGVRNRSDNLDPERNFYKTILAVFAEIVNENFGCYAELFFLRRAISEFRIASVLLLVR
jgi:hypothetical protein